MEMDDGGKITPLSLEALNAARQVAAQGNATVSTLVMGANVSRAVEELECHGIDTLYIKEAPDLERYQPRKFLTIFSKIYASLKPELTIFGNSKNGLDFAARAAVCLDAALVTDCVKIEKQNEEIFFTKPVYSNNVMAVYTSGALPCIITLRSKSTDPSEVSEKRPVEIIEVEQADASDDDEYEIMEEGFDKGDGPRLADADIIVSGGRGMGGPEGFSALQKLADLLDGQLGATRPPCDLGWISPDVQVGITGAIVSPSVYFAVGLSGSFQHMAGMSGSKTIIAVNSDPKANIFKISDYGVVGEYEQVLPGLIEEVGNRR